jgi:hypothetical protein
MIASFGLSKKVHHGKRHKKSKKNQKSKWDPAGFEPVSYRTMGGCSTDSATKLAYKKKGFFTHILIKNL